MFQGDIAQFAPADLLLFLSHMNKEGVLSVHRDQVSLSISFRRNLVIDAESDASERLILERLQHCRAFSPQAVGYLRQAREETGLPMVRILEQGEQQNSDDVAQAMLAGLRETVFRLLLWDRGSFQFTEIPVDDNPHLPGMDGQALVMDLTREVDEYRELVRGLGSLDRPCFVTQRPAECTAEERHVLDQAGQAGSMSTILEESPYTQLSTAWALAAAVDNGWLELATTDQLAGDSDDETGEIPGIFAAYRQTLRHVLQADDQQQHIRELLGFAQAHCVQTILLAVQGDRLRRATVYHRGDGGRLTASDHRDPNVELGMDVVFQQALISGRPFVGGMFPSPILDGLDASCEAAACALLPLGRMGQYDLLLHACTRDPGLATGPLAYLELLSWQVRPPADDLQVALPTEAADVAPSTDGGTDTEADAAAALVSSIKDLPPMPHVAARVLGLLGQADCDMNQLTAALSQDPALVARIIKVSNSSLYGGMQEIGSLDQAIVRLGNRTVRSLVVAASTRSLFPNDSTPTGVLGRELWRHAVQTGLAARRVAEFTRRTDADEAFTAGVLHDLGKVLMLLNRPDEFAEVHRRLEAEVSDPVYAERESLGFDHCLVGERLLESWGLPASLCAAARWHHEPSGAGDLAPLVTVVAAGDLLSHYSSTAGDGSQWRQRRLDAVCASLDLDHSARDDLKELLALDLEQGDLLD